jgi:hypothetical protein
VHIPRLRPRCGIGHRHAVRQHELVGRALRKAVDLQREPALAGLLHLALVAPAGTVTFTVNARMMGGQVQSVMSFSPKSLKVQFSMTNRSGKTSGSIPFSRV